tara:strand:+ start:2266 stop:2448 length:183 start_codon:yes stop_codon:yes gene_type:complete
MSKKTKTNFTKCDVCGDMIEVVTGEGIESEAINCVIDYESEKPIQFFCTSCFQGEFGVDA